MTALGNLFVESDAPPSGERSDVLLAHRNLVIERIVSSADFAARAYEQTQDEWVVLLRGAARLEVAGESVDLECGDHIFLPAGTAHSVRSAAEGTLLLAVHLHAP